MIIHTPCIPFLHNLTHTTRGRRRHAERDARHRGEELGAATAGESGRRLPNC